MKRMAEVAFPENGGPTIGAWISDAGSITGRQWGKAQALLPSCARMWYRSGTCRIEADVPPELRNRVSVTELAKTIRTAISKGLGVRAGFCPVTSSVEIIELTRRGERA